MSDPLDTWTWRNPVPQGSTLYGVAFGAGQYVAVGRSGTVMTSPDGITWTVTTHGTADLLKVRFLNNQFVAVGASGTVLTSPDGMDWTVRDPGLISALCDIAYRNGLYVAVGRCAAITTSSDNGETWTPGDFSVYVSWVTGIAYQQGVFMAVGSDGTILTSSDGVNWTYQPQPTTELFTGIVSGARRLVIVGNAGNILTSTDYGATWTTAATVPDTCFSSVSYEGGMFLALGSKTTHDIHGDHVYGVLSTSVDGTTWATTTFGYWEQLYGAAHGGGTFVIVGYAGTVRTSPDAVNWTKQNGDTSIMFTDVAYGNGTFVAAGYHPEQYQPAALRSTDGSIWSPMTIGSAGALVFSVIYTGNDLQPGFFLASAGKILTSEDAITWAAAPLPVNKQIRGLAAGGGAYVGVGDGTIIRSDDAHNWTAVLSGSAANLVAVAYGNGLFVAVADKGTIMRSSDRGATWSTETSGTTENLKGITFGKGIFAVVGSGGTILTSSDGQAWSTADSSYRQYTGIYFGNGSFAAFGSSGHIVSSPDGTTWTLHNCGIQQWVQAVAYGNGSFVAVGTDSAIMQSEISKSMHFDGFSNNARIPIRPGASVTWTCRAKGRPPLQYAFNVVKAPDPGGPITVRPKKPVLKFGPKPTIVLRLDAGRYEVTGYVKDGSGHVLHRSAKVEVVAARAGAAAGEKVR